MTIELKGVHYDVSDKTREYVDKKLKRLKHVEDLMVDFQRWRIEICTKQ